VSRVLRVVAELNLIVAGASELASQRRTQPQSMELHLKLRCGRKGLIVRSLQPPVGCAFFLRPLGLGTMAGTCGGDVAATGRNLRTAAAIGVGASE